MQRVNRLAFARARLARQLTACGSSPEAIEEAKHLFDPDALPRRDRDDPASPADARPSSHTTSHAVPTVTNGETTTSWKLTSMNTGSCWSTALASATSGTPKPQGVKAPNTPPVCR